MELVCALFGFACPAGVVDRWSRTTTQRWHPTGWLRSWIVRSLLALVSGGVRPLTLV